MKVAFFVVGILLGTTIGLGIGFFAGAEVESGRIHRDICGEDGVLKSHDEIKRSAICDDTFPLDYFIGSP